MEYNLNPIALVFLLLMTILVFSVPRRFILLPILAVAFYLTGNFRVVIENNNFTMLRIIFIFAWIRIFLCSEKNNFSLNSIDKIVLLQVFFYIVVYTILWGTMSKFANRLGLALELISMYFIPRLLIRDLRDIEIFVKALLFMSIPLAITMLIEVITGRNLFYQLFGISAEVMMREEQVRAQASFGHPILAGDFGASIFPLIIGLWYWEKINNKLLFIGIISALLMVFCSNSSGPFMSLIAGIIALCFWPFRNKMKIVFWGVVGILTSLHLVMKAPVWAFIMRIDKSGSSYHRYEILDQTINHFNEWWLLGAKSTEHWGDLKTMGDVANYYCRIAVDSGLIGLLLFLLLFRVSFKVVGNAVRNMQNLPEFQKFSWDIGSSLFVHIIAFFGISYTFTSNLFILYATFAILSTISVIDFKSNDFNLNKTLL